MKIPLNSTINIDLAKLVESRLLVQANSGGGKSWANRRIIFTTKEEILSLRNLEPGEFYAFGPAISRDVVKTTIGDVKVKPPVRGQGKKTPPAPTEKVKALLSQFKDLPVEAEKETASIQSLTTENAFLKNQIRTHKCPTGPDPQKIKGEAEKLVVKAKLEIERSFDEEMRRFKKKITGAKDMIVNLSKTMSSLSKTVSGLHEFIMNIEKENTVVNVPKPVINISIPGAHIAQKAMTTEVPPSIQNTLIYRSVSAPEQKVIGAIAWFESIGRQDPKKISIAILAGYSGSSGGYNNLCGMLRTKGYIVYPTPGNMSLTEAGRTIANMPTAALTQEELHQKVLSVLPAPEGKVLNLLLAAYPHDLSVQELAESAGYQVSSGGFNNLKGRLRSLGLAEYPAVGRIKAADLLLYERPMLQKMLFPISGYPTWTHHDSDT